MSLPAVWGSGITWGDFTWGATTTSGRPVLYVAADGVLLGEAYQARFRLGRSDWFEPMTPQTASFSLVGEHDIAANAEIVVTCGQGTLWKGYVDNATIAYPVGGDMRTMITATDIISRLGRTVKAPGKVYAGPTLTARWYPIGFYGDLVDVTEQYLADFAPDVVTTVTLGTSTGSLPTLTDWYFDAPGPWPKKTLLELLNQAELSSNALMSLQHDGSILIVPRAPSGLSSVTMVDVSSGASTWRRGRDTLYNRWVLERPAYDDVTVLDTSDAASVAAYGERTFEVQDYLCTTSTHFGSAFRTALASPRWIAQYRLPVGDLADPWLMLDPLQWVVDGTDVFQVLGVEHEVTPSDWLLTLDLDASQDALNGATEPTPDGLPATINPLTYEALVSATIPAQLGTLSEPTFGTMIRRITDVNAKRHNYASSPAWNSDGSLMNMGLVTRAMLHGSTYAELQGTQSNQGTLFWSHLTATKAWCQNGTNNGYRRLSANTSTGVLSVAATFAASSISRPGGGVYSVVAMGGVDGGLQGVQSDDDQYAAFMWKASSNDWGIGIMNLSTDTVSAERTMGNSASSISTLMDNCGMSHSGDWAWFTFTPDGTAVTEGMWLYERDLNTSSRVQANISQEHCDWVKTDSGDRFVFWNGNVTSMDPITSTQTVIQTPLSGGTHISGRAYQRPNWVLVSQHQGYSYTDPGASVVFALDVLNPGDAKVFCFHHKTQASATAYNGEIHASPYWDLSKIVMAVNWEGDGTNVYAFVAGVSV